MTEREKSPSAGEPSGFRTSTVRVCFLRGALLASVEEEPFGEGVPLGVEQQELQYAAGNPLALEDQRRTLRFPRFAVEEVAAAEQGERQSLGQGPPGEHLHGEALLLGEHAQHAGVVVGRGEFEPPRLPRGNRTFGVVAFAVARREGGAPHACMERADRVDDLAPRIADDALDLHRQPVVGQRLEGHAAADVVDQVAAFGEELHVERPDAPLRAGSHLCVGPERRHGDRLLEEVVAALIGHEERVGDQRVVAPGVGGQGQIPGVASVAGEKLDAAGEFPFVVMEFDVDVAAFGDGAVRPGVDAVGAQPYGVAREVMVPVRVQVQLLLKKKNILLTKRSK